MHESRHLHALKRTRGFSGRFAGMGNEKQLSSIEPSVNSHMPMEQRSNPLSKKLQLLKQTMANSTLSSSLDTGNTITSIPSLVQMSKPDFTTVEEAFKAMQDNGLVDMPSYTSQHNQDTVTHCPSDLTAVADIEQ